MINRVLSMCETSVYASTDGGESHISQYAHVRKVGIHALV